MSTFGTWYIGSLTNNPTANTVMADSGSLAAGFYKIQAFITSPTNSHYNLEIRDASPATVQSFRLIARANETLPISFDSYLELGANYSIRIIVAANFTANNVQASLLIGKMGGRT